MNKIMDLTQKDTYKVESTKPLTLNLNLPEEISQEVFACGERDNEVAVQKYTMRESQRMLRNLVTVSGVFMLLFTASSCMANLQSSLNPEAGLGTYSRACSNGVNVLSSMFLPTFLIQRLTAKWTLVLGMLGPLFSIAAQLHPTFATMIPAAILSGLFYPPLWAAKCTYLTHMGQQYAELVGKKSEEVITRFFGIFFLIFQTSKVLGNLIASLILRTDIQQNGIDIRNTSVCGRNFCPSHAHDGSILIKPPEWQVYTLAGIYMGMGGVSVLIATLFIDSLQRYGEKKTRITASLRTTSLTAAFRQMANPMQIAIIPLTLWTGLQQGFYGADFYQAFVSCAWGIETLGYVGICYGLCDAVAAYGSSTAVRYIGRIPVFLLGAILNIGTIAALFNWQPDSANLWILFVIAGVWGVSDAIWQTQISAFYGIIFPDNKEAAFSNYRLWLSLGSIIAFINADLLCVNIKMYLLLGTLAIGIICYLLVELLVHRKTQN